MGIGGTGAVAVASTMAVAPGGRAGHPIRGKDNGGTGVCPGAPRTRSECAYGLGRRRLFKIAMPPSRSVKPLPAQVGSISGAWVNLPGTPPICSMTCCLFHRTFGFASVRWVSGPSCACAAEQIRQSAMSVFIVLFPQDKRNCVLQEILPGHPSRECEQVRSRISIM